LLKHPKYPTFFLLIAVISGAMSRHIKRHTILKVTAYFVVKIIISK